MNYILQIILISILTAISCNILGVFLKLRKMAMLTDAISHISLLGIVLFYFIFKNLNNPFLILGASLISLLAVILIEFISKTRLMKEEGAIGFIMTFLFSIAIILISKFTRNVHIDSDSILMGEITFAPLNTINGIPKAIIVSLILIAINLLFVILFYKELKVITFDIVFAKTIGINVTLISYLFISLVSITTVASFEILGSILIISFFVGPPSIAYLFSKSLIEMILYSILISIISSIIGVLIAIRYNVSISGMIAVVIGILLILSMIINCLRSRKSKLKK